MSVASLLLPTLSPKPGQVSFDDYYAAGQKAEIRSEYVDGGGPLPTTFCSSPLSVRSSLRSFGEQARVGS